MEAIYPFVCRLRQMLKDEVYNKLISWGRNDDFLRVNMEPRTLKYYFTRMNLTRGYTLEEFKKELLACGFYTIDVISTEDVLVMRHTTFTRHQSLEEWLEFVGRLRVKKEDEDASNDIQEKPSSLPLSNPYLNRNGTIYEIHRSERSRSRKKLKGCFKNTEVADDPKVEEDSDSGSVICLGSVEPAKQKVVKAMIRVGKCYTKPAEKGSKGSLDDLHPNYPTAKKPNLEKKEEEHSYPKASKRKGKLSHSKSKSKSLVRAGTCVTNLESVASRMQSRSKQHIWLGQLHNILEKKLFEDVIAWSKDGLCIEIRNEARLKKEILGKHLGEKNSYQSFLYYLRYVKFIRLQNKDILCYRHKTLRRGVSLDRWQNVKTIKSRIPLPQVNREQEESSDQTIGTYKQEEPTNMPKPKEDDKVKKEPSTENGYSELETFTTRVCFNLQMMLAEAIWHYEQNNEVVLQVPPLKCNEYDSKNSEPVNNPTYYAAAIRPATDSKTKLRKK